MSPCRRSNSVSRIICQAVSADCFCLSKPPRHVPPAFILSKGSTAHRAPTLDVLAGLGRRTAARKLLPASQHATSLGRSPLPSRTLVRLARPREEWPERWRWCMLKDGPGTMCELWWRFRHVSNPSICAHARMKTCSGPSFQLSSSHSPPSSCHLDRFHSPCSGLA